VHQVEQRVDVVHGAADAPAHALCLTGVVVERPHPPRALEVDEVQSVEVGPVDAPTSGERVVRGGEQHDRLARDRRPGERTQVVGGRDERDVELVGAQLREEVVRAVLREVDLDVRVAVVEPLEQRGRVDDGQALFRADPDRPGDLARHAHDGVARRRRRREHRPGVRQEGEPGVGRLDASRRAREERGAELVLEVSSASATRYSICRRSIDRLSF
jgi:hypothetical protein